MTATDELRRLLDERGVEYGSGFGGDTLWTGRYDIEWRWNKQEDTLAMYSHTITPEQAIAATLGSGECEPIVRCRDCLRWVDDCEWNKHWNDPDIDEPDGFCAWGERREQ